MQPNDRIAVSVRPSATGFYLPPSVDTPIIMVCAGSGIAPFRGFMQERAMQKASGKFVYVAAILRAN